MTTDNDEIFVVYPFTPSKIFRYGKNISHGNFLTRKSLRTGYTFVEKL